MRKCRKFWLAHTAMRVVAACVTCASVLVPIVADANDEGVGAERTESGGVPAFEPPASPDEGRATGTEPHTNSRDRMVGPSGFYVGGHLGYGGGTSSATLLGSGAQGSTSSFGMLAGGVQIGYASLLRSGFVFGVEGDVSFPNFLDDDDRVSSRSDASVRIDEKIDCLSAVRARLGYALSREMIYGTGGFAWSLGHFILDPGSERTAEQRRVRPGWTLGAGLELPVASGWSARIEYAYDRMARGGADFPSGPRTASTLGMHNLWLALNWHLPWPAGASRPEGIEFPQGYGSSNMAVSDLAARSTEGRDNAAEVASRWNVHGQTTFVGQGYPGFHSPYEGPQSLSGSSQFQNTVSATAFFGLRLWHGAELYFNPELMQGFGLSDTHGVAGFPNGEAQRSNFPVPRFNAARVYVSQTLGFGGEQELVEDGPNSLPGKRDVSRLTITAGKLSVTDFYLVSSYAGEPRTGFLNWNVYGTGAYDWTMDLLSWTWGGLVELNQKRWALRAGYFLLPRVANTNQFDFRIPSNGQYLGELEHRHAPFGKPGKLLLFGWLAHGNIGSYPDALAEPATTPGYPDVTLTRGHDRFNYGFAVSAEQTVTDTLGAFVRASWSPEKGESMGWTDCGEAFTLGGTLRGAFWRRPDDTFGLAGLIEGLSPTARRYFTAGGTGTIIGDGALNYRPEMVLETYYAFAPTAWAAATLDYQLVVNPGYNADRGPVSIFAIRLHVAF